MDYGELRGDPTEYNGDRDEGSEATEGMDKVMDGLSSLDKKKEEREPSKYILVDSRKNDWADGGFWFECLCGSNLNSEWFKGHGTTCNDCGREINLKVEIER